MHFFTSIRPLSGLVCLGFCSHQGLPSFSKDCLSPPTHMLLAELQLSRAMTSFSPQICTYLSARAQRRVQRSCSLIQVSQKSLPGTGRPGLPSLSKLAHGAARVICHVRAVWHHCIHPALVIKEGIRK